MRGGASDRGVATLLYTSQRTWASQSYTLGLTTSLLHSPRVDDLSSWMLGAESTAQATSERHLTALLAPAAG